MKRAAYKRSFGVMSNQERINRLSAAIEQLKGTDCDWISKQYQQQLEELQLKIKKDKDECKLQIRQAITKAAAPETLLQNYPLIIYNTAKKEALDILENGNLK